MRVELRLSSRFTLSGVIVAVLLSASTAMAGASEDCAAASSYNEVLRLCRPLAEQGNPNAQLNLGIALFRWSQYRDPQGTSEALEWYRRAAEQGLVQAQGALGNIYEGYSGVPRDDAESAKWYRKAANQGDALSQVALGFMYVDGRGVEKNYAEAMELFRHPAEKGYTWAEYGLGVGYQNGQGVPQDYVLAHMWFNLAAAQAAQGDDDAKKARDLLASKMTLDQIAEAQRLARGWKPSK
jgi:uncharacterized protein